MSLLRRSKIFLGLLIVGLGTAFVATPATGNPSVTQDTIALKEMSALLTTFDLETLSSAASTDGKHQATRLTSGPCLDACIANFVACIAQTCGRPLTFGCGSCDQDLGICLQAC